MRVDLFQIVHGVVEQDQVGVIFRVNGGGIFASYALQAASAFQIMAARMIYQNAPHHRGGNGEKMGAILPLHSFIIHQPHMGFIHQGRGLEAMSRTLALHVPASQAMELVVNDGRQTVEGALISVAPGAEDLLTSSTPVYQVVPPSALSKNYTPVAGDLKLRRLRVIRLWLVECYRLVPSILGPSVVRPVSSR